MLAAGATGSAVVVLPAERLWPPWDKEVQMPGQLLPLYHRRGTTLRKGGSAGLHGAVGEAEAHQRCTDRGDNEGIPPTWPRPRRWRQTSGGDSTSSSPRMQAQAGLKAHKRGLGVKVAHMATHRHPLRPSPIAQAHVACSLGGGDTTPLVATMSTMHPGMGYVAMANTRRGGGGSSGRGASMTAARTTTTGMSWTAAVAMRPAARRAPPQRTRADGGRSKEEGRQTSICKDVRRGERDPQTEDGGD
jgi:hypothetical protein